MTQNDIDSFTTKGGLLVGTVAGGLTLAQIDLLLAICLKVVSIVSFIIVIVLNLGKLKSKLKDWFKRQNP